MSRSVATLGLIGALMLGGLLGGCQPLEVDQVAQQSMIGLAKHDILACFGEPAGRAKAGQATEIWTYTGGRMRGYGPQFSLGCREPGRSVERGLCRSYVLMTNARVSEVGYAAVDGQALPLGQECLFSVERCVKAP